MMNRRKELIEQYKQLKPDMGILWIRCLENKKCFLETSQNLRGMMNRTKFQLEAGSHPNEELQKEWREFGEEKFICEVLEKLKYAKDETKTDYREELAILRFVWEEKLLEEEYEFYRKKVNEP